jgi:hypothetical protein
MIVKTVAVTYGRKLNLGDYNSAHVECTLWADLEEGESEHDVMTGLWAMAKTNVKVQLLPLTPNHAADVDMAFLGIPIEGGEHAD